MRCSGLDCGCLSVSAADAQPCEVSARATCPSEHESPHTALAAACFGESFGIRPEAAPGSGGMTGSIVPRVA